MSPLSSRRLETPSERGKLLFARRAGLFCLTFLCIIPMQITLGRVTVGVALVMMGLLTLIHVGLLILAPRSELHDSGFVLVLFVSLIYFLANALMGGMRDTTAVVICLYGFVIFSASLVLALGHRRLYGPGFVSAGLWSIFAVGVLNAAVQIAVLANEDVSAAVYAWVNISEDSATHISQGYRSPGLFSWVQRFSARSTP